MTAFLANCYITIPSLKEILIMDERSEKSRQEFQTGFIKGLTVSAVVYNLYSILTSVAYAIDQNSIALKGPIYPVAVTHPTPTASPGFRPLMTSTKFCRFS